MEQLCAIAAIVEESSEGAVLIDNSHRARFGEFGD
jgi:hypothetical protein